MLNPFLISGPASIGFSGGRTSAYMTKQILEAYGGQLPADILAIFENTGEEDERTLEFIEECTQRWKLKVIWLEYFDEFHIEKYRNSRGEQSKNRKRRDLSDPGDCGFRTVNFKTASRKGEPYDMMLRYYAEYRKQCKDLPPILPNMVQRLCTAFLKIKINQRYMQSVGFETFDSIAGIRYDEPKRYAKMMKANEKGSERYDYVLPLYEARITKPMIMDFWDAQPFDLQLDRNSDEGNCRYCFLKAKHKIVTIARKHLALNDGQVPADFQRWIGREELTGQVFRRDRPKFVQLLAEARSEAPIEKPPLDEPVIDCICGEA